MFSLIIDMMVNKCVLLIYNKAIGYAGYTCVEQKLTYREHVLNRTMHTLLYTNRVKSKSISVISILPLAMARVNINHVAYIRVSPRSVITPC